MDQELSLLAFLDQRITKVGRCDRLPVYFVQVPAVHIERCKARSSIPVGKGPAHTTCFRPTDSLFHVGLEMEDGVLASVVCYVRMIAHVQNIKHDRTRTEIEGNIVPNLCARVALYVIIEQSPAFDFGHAD